jgi:hypothetical protein
LEGIIMATKNKLAFGNDAQELLSAELLAVFSEVKELYKAHKAEAKALPSYSAHKDAQAAFEAMLAETLDIPAGKQMVCSYNYGKLAIAFKDIAKAKATPVAPRGSLNDWLKQQGILGQNV